MFYLVSYASWQRIITNKCHIGNLTIFPFYFHALFELALITLFPIPPLGFPSCQKVMTIAPPRPSPNPLDLGTLSRAKQGCPKDGGGKPTTYPHTNIVAVLPLTRFGQKTVCFTVDLSDSKTSLAEILFSNVPKQNKSHETQSPAGRDVFLSAPGCVGVDADSKPIHILSRS